MELYLSHLVRRFDMKTATTTTTGKRKKVLKETKNSFKMSNMLKVAKLAREYIKPSKLTPHHLRNFKLSFLDQLSPSVYAPMVFFYPSQGQTQSSFRSQHLKNSLSDFLTRFYPFAGRIRDHMSVNCDDAGVEFIEAKANTTLNHLLNQPNVHDIKRFIPIDIESEDTKRGSDQLVHVQSSALECGGSVIGVCWNHKLADACTASVFMKGWSLAARGLPHELVPHYTASSLFPPMSSSIDGKALKLDMERTVTKRFVFGGAKIAALKSLAAGPRVPNPTRVEAVSSLVWKSATNASRKLHSRPEAVSVMSQSVNIRGRTDPPLPISTIGNLVGYYLSRMERGDDDETNLAGLVAKQRRGKAEIAENYVKKLQGEGEDRVLAIRDLFKEATSLLSRDDVEFYKCMSVSGDGLYDLDFGWGKPVWSSVVTLGYKNVIVLNQTRDGEGIEAWVTLAEDVMGLFESDPEVIEFASLNPSAVDQGKRLEVECACWKQMLDLVKPKRKEPVDCYCYNLACNVAAI